MNYIEENNGIGYMPLFLWKNIREQCKLFFT